MITILNILEVTFVSFIIIIAIFIFLAISPLLAVLGLFEKIWLQLDQDSLEKRWFK